MDGKICSWKQMIKGKSREPTMSRPSQSNSLAVQISYDKLYITLLASICTCIFSFWAFFKQWYVPLKLESNLKASLSLSNNQQEHIPVNFLFFWHKKFFSHLFGLFWNHCSWKRVSFLCSSNMISWRGREASDAQTGWPRKTPPVPWGNISMLRRNLLSPRNCNQPGDFYWSQSNATS